MRILITGGSGFIATEIFSQLKDKYNIHNPGRKDLNLLEIESINKYFDNDTIYDLVIHTAIIGGSRLDEDESKIFYNNLKMFYNLLEYKHKFKKFINFSSGAAYDRNTNINGSSEILKSNPEDYYGLSKNIIDRLIFNMDNFYIIRIFNVYSEKEKDSRFIKICKKSVENNENIIINNDRYFDFFNSADLIKVIEYYINNNKLEKDIDLCYKNKYKLSDIAKNINKDNKVKIIINSNCNLNYIGNYKKLYNYNMIK